MQNPGSYRENQRKERRGAEKTLSKIFASSAPLRPLRFIPFLATTASSHQYLRSWIALSV